MKKYFLISVLFILYSCSNIYVEHFEGTNIIPVAQVHTHNLIQDSRKINIPGTSIADKNASRSFNIPIFAVDSYIGNTPNGNAIHRVLPNGTQINNVGTTNNHNIGQEALNHFINKQRR